MNYGGIYECDVANGIGNRTVLFVSACGHKCDGCQNKQTWNPNFGSLFTKETLDYILNCLSKPYIDGITLTGGDPLYEGNLETVLDIIQTIKKQFPNKTIWLYTGYTWKELEKNFNEYKYTPFSPSADEWLTRWEIISLCDILVDGKFEKDKKDLTLPFRGSSNQRVIDVKQTLLSHTLTLYQPN